MKKLNLTGLSRTSYSTNAHSTGTLTLKNLESIYRSVKLHDVKEQKRINKIIRSKSWQKENRQLHALSFWLFQQNRFLDSSIAYQCYYSIQPDMIFPVSLKTKKRCEELLAEYNLTIKE